MTAAMSMTRFSGALVGRALRHPHWTVASPVLGQRAYSIYEDFDVLSGAQSGRIIINGYDETGFFANGVRHEGAMICLGKLIFSWTPRSLAEITPESLAIFQLLRPAPEILVFGSGKTMQRVTPEVRDFLRSNGIKIEAVDTRNAASTFNILNEEGRQVAAAMLPQGWSGSS